MFIIYVYPLVTRVILCLCQLTDSLINPLTCTGPEGYKDNVVLRAVLAS